MKVRQREIMNMIQRAERDITSPAESALLEISKALLTEIVLVDAEITIIDGTDDPGAREEDDPSQQQIKK